MKAENIRLLKLITGEWVIAFCTSGGSSVILTEPALIDNDLHEYLYPTNLDCTEIDESYIMFSVYYDDIEEFILAKYKIYLNDKGYSEVDGKFIY